MSKYFEFFITRYAVFDKRLIESRELSDSTDEKRDYRCCRLLVAFLWITSKDLKLNFYRRESKKMNMKHYINICR